MPFNTPEKRAAYEAVRRKTPERKKLAAKLQKQWRLKNLDNCREYEARWAREKRARLRGDKPRYFRAPWKTREEKLLVKRASRRRFYQRHKSEINASAALDRANNPEKYRAIDAARWAEDKDRRTLNNFIQRAKRYGVRLYCTPKEWIALLQRFDFQCFYCQVQLSKKTRTLDHKLPLSRGGTNEIDNLVPACRRCNQRKNKKTAEEFFVLIINK